MHLNHIKEEMKSIKVGTYYSNPHWHMFKNMNSGGQLHNYEFTERYIQSGNVFLEL